MTPVIIISFLIAVVGTAVIFWFASRTKSNNAAVASIAAGERQIQQSANAIREIITSINEVVENVENSAGSSSVRLQRVHGELAAREIAPALKDAQEALLEEVERMQKHNEQMQHELETARRELTTQREMIESLRSAARIDSLTQLANRAHFDEYLLAAIDRLKRYEEVFSLLMIDIDHFKAVNDKYGHLAGDRLLKGMGKKLKASLRGSDFVARYGGEEFSAILIKAPLESALSTARTVRESVEFSLFNLDGVELRVTISIGVAQARVGDSPQTLIARADAALYDAKRAGRNVVCVERMGS